MAMPSIRFLQADGSQREIAAGVGQTVKDVALAHLVPGIIGECGGACACGTCHVHVDEGWWSTVGGPHGEEAEMLEFADSVGPTSRLACQIKVTEEMDGLVVYIPPTT